jgi:hypothetical protein
MSQPFNIDHKGVLIDKLGEDLESFQTSNLILKNTKGLNAIYEINRLEAELYDFAKDPSLKDKQIGNLRPKQPNTKGLSEEEAKEEEDAYRQLMREYEVISSALKMQVPVEDMFAIEQYMKPFLRTINATPAVKGKRFHAFTKDVNEQTGGFLGLGKKQGPQG